MLHLYSTQCHQTSGVVKIFNSYSTCKTCYLSLPISLSLSLSLSLGSNFKIYLLNRSLYVNIENSKSFQLLYGVPQGSVLSPLLFILYTTPLSTVISNSSANHQLYADNNTQLLLSFSFLDFSHNITHLDNTITNVANWMSSNFLSLNPSKTEFLIFGLPQHLSKLNNPTIHLFNNVILSPVDSARNLGVIFDKKICHYCATYLFYF